MFRGLFYYLIAFSVCFFVPILWYLPRMRVRTSEGVLYRLYLVGQCLSFMGALTAVIPIIEIRHGQVSIIAFLAALTVGAVLGLLTAVNWTSRWDRDLRDKLRIESGVHRGDRLLFLAVSFLLIVELHAEKTLPILVPLRITAFSCASGFALLFGTLTWLWAVRKERLTRRVVEILLRKM